MEKLVKCLVWDLDDTLWSGTLLEGDELTLRPQVPSILQELNRRGILNSIASRNERKAALSVLRKFEVEHYFVAPQINTNPKPENLRQIAQDLNLGLDSLAFIDDSPFEREAVKFSCPPVLVLEAERYHTILDMQEFMPPVQTPEARKRAEFYRVESVRQQAERDFEGSRVDFLESCQIHLLLREAEATDIPRIVELAQRTNQFNSTAIRYDTDQVKALRAASNVRIFIGELRDRFGSYGAIGVMVLRLEGNAGVIESVMISCRAAGRGVPAAMLITAMRMGKAAGVDSLRVQYRPNERNRQLAILYSMLEFQRLHEQSGDGLTVWCYDLAQQPIPEVPVWLTYTTSIGPIQI